MNSEKFGNAEPNDEEMDQGILKQFTVNHGLDEELSPDQRDGALALLKRLMASRSRKYERKYQRQIVLQHIRDSVHLLRSRHKDAHVGFLAALMSIESSIDLDFDSLKKGYIDS